MFENKAVVDAHGCILRPRVPYIGMCVCVYIRSVGFCIAYSRLKVFLGPLKADKQ